MLDANAVLACGLASTWDLTASSCVHPEPLVVHCWPSSLTMMQVGFQASTSFLSQWVPWGERRGSWYGLIVWACCSGARLWNNGPHWWRCMALHVPKRCANAHCRGQAWKSTVRHNQVGVQDQRWPPPSDSAQRGQARASTACSLQKARLWVWADISVLKLWDYGPHIYFQHLPQAENSMSWMWQVICSLYLKKVCLENCLSYTRGKRITETFLD